ncbi:MAG: thermophilic metalloprotease (M29) superfamily [Candidatus Taylorbacteria bacterium RIFCSPHIGHO2_02_49_25]|uniref:Thermophilic metalloprotease (M29) superfamily n=1 Tax=Candidatus Taylorbacteria bacterium RIFCSPHIGHO2_02_49_25 TaxID=1802305 RepID=A0A1G2MHD1_9BACT|nr:MAG: thermophilic metalloprotease (M29) superfamily [Candidatus Taylorbacteria bacterium RIFCSPHIGHO2_01_FULL_49_60]OHA23243.1 MAG: thermophilic metalloprotease (M29) superfamily [Candidatus Taylorbacteria bacterium RIFCSPHIGHO2_02_49_25]OHA35553.1 MAG: thermophilic metalloprotease (M29) superfamily [Candidatus Taylorbacteria bacterium RIFCSPLOWO2_02_50_13]OHA46349.1 MAG: thermophilic metalloprotease (M29) superfamily [Candidatus Taylorbacteria bacterium RIFCSPLOWO2_12_FULL_49_67]
MYAPPQKILERYADVLVNFALGGGKGIKKGEVVHLVCYEAGKALFLLLKRAILKSGGHIIPDYRPDSGSRFPFDRTFFELAKPHQLRFFPRTYARGLVSQMDHTIFVISEVDLHELEGIPPKKIMRRGLAWKPYMDWRQEKETRGKYTWTIALFGTGAMAREAKLSEKAYWDEIIRACFLDKKNPIREWKKVYGKLEQTRKKLNSLPIEKLHVKGPDADLWIHLGKHRRWMGGSGRNIPSFELFTSPDWRGTSGWIRFNMPLYHYGVLIEGVELWFKDGRVVKSKARKNEKVLQEMIRTPNADKIGEYSLTDKRFSRIRKFMATTLYDENIGGRYGNTHLALGKSYHDCYTQDPGELSPEDWERLGFNNSSVHTDIISTTPRTVTAVMRDGSKKVIYRNGRFVL